jgi:hypothetical protein
MTTGFIQGVFAKAVVESYPDSRRIVLRDVLGFGDMPLGRKIQNPGPRCRPWRHEWVIDTYPGIRHEYVDKVCGTCSRRKMVT